MAIMSIKINQLHGQHNDPTCHSKSNYLFRLYYTFSITTFCDFLIDNFLREINVNLNKIKEHNC